MLYGLQSPAITDATLSECDRVIRKTVKRILHLARTTGNQFLHASIKDGGLGVLHLRWKIPHIMLRRIQKTAEIDPQFAAVAALEPTKSLIASIEHLASKGDPNAYWRQEISTRPFSTCLQDVAQESANRAWLRDCSTGWTGRDFVKAVQLRTGNLPCRGIPSTPPDERRCRAGCARVESISHILQGCPRTHHERIRRHDEIVSSHLRFSSSVTA